MNSIEQDILHIKKMMDKSAKFISLSGLSGVAVGTIALASCSWVFYLLHIHQINYFEGMVKYFPSILIKQLILIELFTLAMALWSAYFFTLKQSQKTGEKLWTVSLRNMIISALPPLVIGGIFSLIVTYHNLLYLVAPSMLLFYGLALINASKYTRSELWSLGLLQLILGVFSLFFLGYGLLFWGLGFGVLHIIYGIIMHKKYNINE